MHAGIASQLSSSRLRRGLFRRQRLKPLVLPGAAEGILCDAGGHLLEGMLTNLFIVAGDSFQGNLCKVMLHS